MAVNSPTNYANVEAVAMLAFSDDYNDLLGEMKAEQLRDEKTAPLDTGSIQLVAKMIEMTARIDSELAVIHKFVRDKYEKRFPELEKLVPNQLDYIVAVSLFGNDININGPNRAQLSQFLSPSTLIVVSVTASTTQGKPLTQEELASVQDACSLATGLSQDRQSMLSLVQRRMILIAPNLVDLLGAETAAALVAQAGGLSSLARMPACNIQVLGAQKRQDLVGFSSTNQMVDAGILWHHPLVSTLKPDIRKNVVKILANKTALAARPDSQKQAADGSIGRLQLEKVHNRIKKLIEPPQVKHVKALPKPLDKASKKRGGRRVRKMKEKTGMSEMRKAANRMNFGVLEEDIVQESIGFGVGQLKQGGSSRIRMGVKNEKTRVKMSKKLKKTMDKQNCWDIRLTGMTTSVSFTPVKGLEIVNPNAEKNANGLKSTYF